MRDLRFSGKRPQKVRGLRLSTNVLLRSLEFEANWDTLVAMLEELKNQRDVYDVAPLLKLSLEETLPHWVRRAAIECAAIHDTAASLQWLGSKVKNRYLPTQKRILAIQALAALQLPDRTLPLLEEIADQRGSPKVRMEAIQWLGRFQNLRSLDLLLELKEDQDRGIRQASRKALDHVIDRQGGPREVVEKMKERAEKLYQQGRITEARRILKVAARLAPHDWEVRRWLRQLAA